MSFVHELHAAAAKANLPFIVIGGHAVNALGISRETADFDILVTRDDEAGWRGLLGALGYTVRFDGGNFLQMNPPPASTWPVDLMLVNGGTFSKLWASATEGDLMGLKFKIPAPEHLIALKLHALRQDKPHRALKDFLDVVAIIQTCSLDLESSQLRETFSRYGTDEILERVRKAVGP
jgi:hypothetical protein